MRAFLHSVVARVRGFLHPGAHDADFDDELAAHLEQTVGDMLTWRRELRLLQEVGGFVLQQRVVADTNGATRLVRAAAISPSAFQMIRIPPLMGRPLVDGDERPGAAVVVVGFDVWQSAFGGDPGIVGKSIRIGGDEHTVVGVMPAEFRFPVSEQLWTPLRVVSDGLGPGEGAAAAGRPQRLRDTLEAGPPDSGD